MARRAFAALGAVLALLACAEVEETPEQAIDRAREALEAGDRDSARQAVSDLRAERLDDADALLELASILSRSGETPRAVWMLEDAVARFPTRDDLHVALGQAALVVANPVLARDSVASIDAESPQHLDALLVRARAALELGDLERALRVLEQAEALYPDDPKAAAARIATLVREQRLDEAAEAIEAAKRSGAFADEQTSLEVLAALIEIAQGDTDAAIARLEARAQAAPDDALARLTLVQMLLRAGRIEDARAQVEGARARDPQRPELAAALAEVRLRAGDEPGAAEAMREYARLSDAPSAVVQLSDFHAHLDQPELAVRALRDGVARFPDAARLRMHLAEALIESGDRSEARRRAREFREAAPDDPHVEYLEARLALADGDAESAARRLRSVLPRLDRAYTQFWLGRALEESGDLAGAERRYGLASLRDRSNPAPSIALLRLARARGDAAALAGHALQLVERAPLRPEGYATAVTALVRRREPDQAVAIARLYAQRFPGDAEAAALLAFALRAAGELDAAERQIEAAREEHGDAPAIAIEQALIRASRGDVEAGRRALEASAAERPDDAKLQAALAGLHFAAGDTERGVAATERALELAPADLEPLALRARYLAARGDRAAALRDCERYLAARPGDAGVHFMRGVLLSVEGRPEQAEAAYRRAIELDESDFAARNNLALLLEETGRPEEALRVAQEAYALADSDPDVADTLGSLYLRRGLPKRALALLERAEAAKPGRPSTQLHLAAAYAQSGRNDDARRLLEALLARVEPASPIRAQARAALSSLGE